MGVYINLVQMAMYYVKNTDRVENSENSIMLDSVYAESSLAQYVEREIENNSLFSSFDITYNMGPLFKKEWNNVINAFASLLKNKEVSVVDYKARENADVDIIEPKCNTGLKVRANTYAVRISSFTCTMVWLPNLIVIKNDRELKVYTYNLLDFSFVNTQVEKKKKINNYGTLKISGPYMTLEIQSSVVECAELINGTIEIYKKCFPINKEEEESDIEDIIEEEKKDRIISKSQKYTQIIKSLGFEVGFIDGQHLDTFLVYLFKSNSGINDDLQDIQEVFNNKLGDYYLFKEVGDDEFLIYEETEKKADENTYIKRVLDDAIERSKKMDIHKKAKKNMGNVKDSALDKTAFVRFENKENVAKTTNSPKKPQANMENFKAVTKEDSIESIFDELNSLTGLRNVKKELRELTFVVQNRQRREKQGLKTPPISLHLVFTGNPGTGKTTVARYVAKIYKCLGLLSEGQMVETDRSGLVAGYVGQTAIKTKEVIDSALGGVLFIDEAYALTNKTEGDFGIEAVDTLLKAMEDNRDNLVVIVAGYDDLMEEFINSNPGLKSRFNRFIHFDDYKPEEMYDIFEGMCRKYQYTVSDEAKDMIISYLENADAGKMGNGRGVRNLFEKVITKQAKRLETSQSQDIKDLQLIIPDDFRDIF